MADREASEADCICPDEDTRMANCPRHGLRPAILGLAGATVAAGDQAQAMTDAELAERLFTGRWTTIEVHEAGRRLRTQALGRPAPTPSAGTGLCPPSHGRPGE